MGNLCKKCGGPIRWKKEATGWQCFDTDGAVHWDTCSKLSWQRIVETGEYFELGKRKGYEMPDGKIHYSEISYGWKTGKHYKPCLRKCSVAPWDDCPQYPECNHA